MNAGIRILYIEDETALARLVQHRLVAEGYEADLAATAREGLERYDPARHDVVVVDYHLPDATGLAVLEELVRRGTGVPVVVVTGAGSEEVAVQAMKLGASDYIVKESATHFFSLLPQVVARAVQQRRLLEEKRRVEERMRSIMRSIDDLVLVIDHEGRFIDVHAPAGGAVGPAWVGRGFAEVLSAEGVHCLSEAIAKVMRGDGAAQFDCRLGDRPEAAWYDAKVSPLRDASGAFAGITVVARDITARRRDEDRLRLAKQEAEAASRGEERAARGHVPRAAYSPHGHHRLRGDPPVRVLRPGERAPAPAARHRAALLAPPAGADQRHPRHREDRGRARRARVRHGGPRGSRRTQPDADEGDRGPVGTSASTPPSRRAPR